MKLTELFQFKDRTTSSAAAPTPAEPRQATTVDVAEVDQVLAQLAGTQKLPKAMEKLIHQYWKKVLQAVYREHGRESRHWNIALQITRDLLWSLTPKHTEEERERLMAMLPGLIHSVHTGLSTVIRDAATVDKAMVVLGKQHLSCLKKTQEHAHDTQSAQSRSDLQIDVLDPSLTLDSPVELEKQTKIIDPKKYAPGLIKATGGWVYDQETQEWVFIGE